MVESIHSYSDHLVMDRKRNAYSGSFKAQIVSQLINRKRSLKELAALYEVHPNQIKNWKSTLLREASFILEDKRRTRTKSGIKKPRKDN